MPKLCIASANDAPITGDKPYSKVKAGNATAPPPSELAPAINAPASIMSAIGQYAEKLFHKLKYISRKSHVNNAMKKKDPLVRNTDNIANKFRKT